VRFGGWFGWFYLVVGVVCLSAAAVLGVLAIPRRLPGERGLRARRADRVHDAAPDVQLGQPDARLRGGRRPGGRDHVAGRACVSCRRRALRVTTSVPETALATHLGNSEVAGGLGAFLVLAFVGARRRRADVTQAPTGPVLAAAVAALVLGGAVLMISGWALGGKPSRTGPDLAATGAALVVVLGLSAWLGSNVKRRASHPLAYSDRAQGVADGAHNPHTPVPHPARHAQTARPPLRARMQPANVAGALGSRAAALLPSLLTVAVLFGVFFTSLDGPAARAFLHAPACRGETNLGSCVGDFTAVINGVRAPANGASFADVSYATYDGAINTWARFDGDAPRSLPSSSPSASRCSCSRCGYPSIAGQDRG
jgi:hypothetical protein